MRENFWKRTLMWGLLDKICLIFSEKKNGEKKREWDDDNDDYPD